MVRVEQFLAGMEMSGELQGVVVTFRGGADGTECSATYMGTERRVAAWIVHPCPANAGSDNDAR